MAAILDFFGRSFLHFANNRNINKEIITTKNMEGKKIEKLLTMIDFL